MFLFLFVAAGLSRLNLQQLDLHQPHMSSVSHFQQNYPSHHFHQPPIGSVPVGPHLMPNNGDLTVNTLQNPAVGSAIIQPMPTSPTGPPPAFPSIASASSSLSSTTSTSSVVTTTSSSPSSLLSLSITTTTAPITTTSTTSPSISTRTLHNDLNDAQNISEILKSSIHNGTSSQSTIGAASNHINNDKRLFIDEDEPQVNHKDERSNNNNTSNNNNNNTSTSNSNNDKNHHRSKRKAKSSANRRSSPIQTITTTAPVVVAVTTTTTIAATALTKKNSEKHIHTNGLIDSKKANNNQHSTLLVNGDDDADDETLDKLKEENMETRSLVFREIRKLGRDYSGLYEQLSKIKGNFDIRFSFIQMCIDEASRFRRKHMADCIQEWWATRCDDVSDLMGKRKT